MAWLTWRQHRAEAWVCAGLLLLCCLFFGSYGFETRDVAHHDGVHGCLRSTSPACDMAITSFLNHDSAITDQVLPMFALAFGLIGVIIGAQLMARELEHGTWQLAWTQGVTQTRWLAVKLSLIIPALIVFSLVLSALVTWYRGPLDTFEGRFGRGSFDLEGISPAGYTLAAFSLGVLAAVLLRQTVSAIVAAYLTFVSLRLAIELLLRPHYLPPLTRVSAFASILPPGSWVIDSGYADQKGHHLPISQIRQLRTLAPDSAAFHNLLATRHIGFWMTYQPDGRFWSFQAIETGIFCGIACAALAIAIWLLRRANIP